MVWLPKFSKGNAEKVEGSIIWATSVGCGVRAMIDQVGQVYK